MKQIEPIFQHIESSTQDMIELQGLLCSIPAIAPENGGDGEMAKAAALCSYLHRLGFRDIERYDAPDQRVSAQKRPNLVVTMEGEVKDKNFWIMSHLDVVPPGELRLWTSDPFIMQRQGDKLIGRGCEDNQQGLVSSVFAAVAFLQTGQRPHYTVKLLFVSDEEVGSHKGIKYLLENTSLFAPDDFFLVPDAGNQDGTMVEIAEKNMLWLKFTTKGKQCHASMPQNGVNALVAGSALVLRLNELNSIFSAENSLFNPPSSTFMPTKKDPNVQNINTIPGEDIFYLDCRILPQVGTEKVLKCIGQITAEVEREFKVTIEREIIMDQQSIPTPDDCPLVGETMTAIRAVSGGRPRPMGVGGGTVAAFLRNKNFPAVVWATHAETAHMPNEYCLIGNMVNDAKVMAMIMGGIKKIV